MKPRSLLNGQNIRICDHKRDGRSVHDFHDPSSAIHIDKEPNDGVKFNGKIRIPLKGDVSVDVPECINKNLTHKQLKDIKATLTQEIMNAFADENSDNISKENFISQIVNILRHDWNDKLSSKERAIDVAARLANTFDLGAEIKHLIKEQENKIKEYSSMYKSNGKRYYISIQTDVVELGEACGTKENKFK